MVREVEPRFSTTDREEVPSPGLTITPRRRPSIGGGTTGTGKVTVT